MTSTQFAALKDVVDAQFGLITHTQLRALGFPHSRVRHRVESGLWQAVLHGVYAVSSGPISREMALEAHFCSEAERPSSATTPLPRNGA